MLARITCRYMNHEKRFKVTIKKPKATVSKITQWPVALLAPNLLGLSYTINIGIIAKNATLTRG
jgi:hypothetical protein